uniref:Putative secreted protein n=1 Tax=Ixodes ricinus TaxID=34613 RepID=A0A6B0UAR4_IXORI
MAAAACWCSFSRYNCATRLWYFCWASVVLQLCCWKKATAFALPPTCMARSCSQVQLVSSWVERTKDRCTPRERCTAEQSMQMKTP